MSALAQQQESGKMGSVSAPGMFLSMAGRF